MSSYFGDYYDYVQKVIERDGRFVPRMAVPGIQARQMEARTIDSETFTYNSAMSCARMTSIIFLRMGFLLIQLGSIPVENAFSIIMHNIAEIAVVVFSYLFIGFKFSFGHSTLGGVISVKGYIGQTNIMDLDDAVTGLCASLFATSILSTYLVARVRKVPMFAITFVFCAFYQPMLMHWMWTDDNWLKGMSTVGSRKAFDDYGGNLTIHLPASIAGLTGALFLGRKVLKVKDMDQFSLGSEYVSATILGYFLIIIGVTGFSLPGPRFMKMDTSVDIISTITINNMMAISAGILMTSIANYFIHGNVYKYWVAINSIQGALAAMVSIAAGLDVYRPPFAFAVAFIGTTVYFVSSNIIRYWSGIEDCCNITATFLVPATVGSMLPGLLGTTDGDTPNGYRLYYTAMQFMALGIVIGATVVLFTVLIAIAWGSGILRNNYEQLNHLRAVELQKTATAKRPLYKRIFQVDRKTKEIVPGRERKQMVEVVTVERGNKSNENAV